MDANVRKRLLAIKEHEMTESRLGQRVSREIPSGGSSALTTGLLILVVPIAVAALAIGVISAIQLSQLSGEILTIPQGPRGYNGSTGDTGPIGPMGLQGYNGSTGEPGIQGPQGYNGSAGATGPQGPQGYNGSTGSTGDQGPQGYNGSTGATGPQGPQGYNGSTGATGAQGPQGYNGSIGATGPQGPQGYNGSTGATGPQGVNGSTGATGPQGTSYQPNTNVALAASIQGGTLPATGNIKLLDYSGGPGFITGIQVAITYISGGSQDALLTQSSFVINLDGVALSGTLYLGNYLMVFEYPNTFQADNINIQGAVSGSGVSVSRMNLFIPFTSSTQVFISNPSIGVGNVTSQIYYSTGTPPNSLSANGLRVKWNFSFNLDLSTVAYASQTLLSITGKTGQIESVYLMTRNCGSLSTLEGAMSYTIDGVTNAYSTASTDNYFGGQHYWNVTGTPTFFRSPKWGLVQQYTANSGSHTNAVANSAYRYHGSIDPINWSNNITLTWSNGKVGQGLTSPGTCKLSYTVTYWTST